MEPTPQRDLPPERKTLYYVGVVIQVIGGLTFFSCFLTAALSMGNHNMSQMESAGKSFALRGFLGMGLLIAGSIISKIGRSGLAGSGITLDPQQARKDLEPYNRAAGGMTADTLDEIPLVHTLTEKLSHPTPPAPPPIPLIKIRCHACQTLNEEDAKFCKQCGGPL